MTATVSVTKEGEGMSTTEAELALEVERLLARDDKAWLWANDDSRARQILSVIRPLIEEEAREKVLQELCEFWPDGLVVVSRGPKETVRQVVKAFATEHNIPIVTKGETE
jgi:hypothetical protein